MHRDNSTGKVRGIEDLIEDSERQVMTEKALGILHEDSFLLDQLMIATAYFNQISTNFPIGTPENRVATFIVASCRTRLLDKMGYGDIEGDLPDAA